MKRLLMEALRFFVGGFVVFSALLTLGLFVYAIDRFGFEGAAFMTGIITWFVLALIGLLKVLDYWADWIIKDIELKRDFGLWYFSRLRARRGEKERFPA